MNDIMQIRMAKDIDEQTTLCRQFADDPWLSEVVEALTGGDMQDIWTCHQARHHALNFSIQDGQLWHIWMKAKDRVAWVECIPQTEGVRLVSKVHEQNGHFGWDHTWLKLHDKWFWLGMDRDSKEAVTACPRCKNFGPQFINSLLRPIKWWEPFDLISADYLSLPRGKGGYKTVLLVTDTFSTFVWAYKLKSAGTGKSMLTGLQDLCLHYCKPDAFMTDGGSHFDNNEVNKFCE